MPVCITSLFLGWSSFVTSYKTAPFACHTLLLVPLVSLLSNSSFGSDQTFVPFVSNCTCVSLGLHPHKLMLPRFGCMAFLRRHGDRRCCLFWVNLSAGNTHSRFSSYAESACAVLLLLLSAQMGGRGAGAFDQQLRLKVSSAHSGGSR